MLGTSYHVQIDGTQYQVNQVVENPYTETGGPLRSPAAQVVQGVTSEFNLRQDVLRFQWTDWSGGMGQNKFDSENPSAYFDGYSIDGFSKPGILRAGRAVQRSQDSTGAADFTHVATTIYLPTLSGANNTRWLYIGTNGYKWDLSNQRWGAANAITGITGGVRAVTFYDSYNWLVDDNSIIQMSPTPGYVDWVTGLTISDVTPLLASLGNKLYLVETSSTTGLKVTEFATTGTPPITGTVIYEDTLFDGEVASGLVVTHNRLYFATNDYTKYKTQLWEIVPSTVAGAGSAFPKFTMPMYTSGIFHHSGVIYFVGQGRFENPYTSADPVEPLIRYFVLSANTFGVVATLDPMLDRTTRTFATVCDPAEFPLGFMFCWYRDSSWTVGWMDTVKGAVHPLAHIPFSTGVAAYRGISVLTGWDGELLTFQNAHATNPQYVFWLENGLYEGDATSPYCISPSFNLNIPEDKILSSISVDMAEAVPTNWRVDISYMLDDDPNWTTAGSLVAGEISKKITTSSYITTLTFSWMRLVIQFVWLGTGHPTTTPEVQYVEARAQIPDKLRTWDLILDCSDDLSNVDGQSLTGQSKADKIRTLGLSGSVVLFRDGFTSYQPDNYDTYNVVVDSYQINYSKPGEGEARVRLMEVA